jgi:hypothetical protein
LDGDTGTVTGFKIEKLDKPISVYNLEVEDFHTYFVEDLLVHNKCTWLKKLRDQGREVPDGMVHPHGHHILPKVGIKGVQQMLVKIGQEVLREVGIDPINGLENLVIAPNIKGVHTRKRIAALVLDLCLAAGDREQVIAVLHEYGQIAANTKPPKP